MRLNKQLLITLLFIISGCIGPVTQKKPIVDEYTPERNNSMELLELLELFTSGNSWEIGSDDIRIKWLTGVKFNNSKGDYSQFWYKKIGSLHITMDDEFSDFYIRERPHPVPWSITMYGARTIFSECIIKTDTTGGGHDAQIIEDYLKKKGVLVKKLCYKIKEGYSVYGSYDFEELEIELPNSHRHIFVLHQALYMNNVCDQVLYLNSTGSSDISKPKDLSLEYDKNPIKCLDFEN